VGLLASRKSTRVGEFVVIIRTRDDDVIRHVTDWDVLFVDLNLVIVGTPCDWKQPAV